MDDLPGAHHEHFHLRVLTRPHQSDITGVDERHLQPRLHALGPFHVESAQVLPTTTFNSVLFRAEKQFCRNIFTRCLKLRIISASEPLTASYSAVEKAYKLVPKLHNESQR